MKKISCAILKEMELQLLIKAVHIAVVLFVVLVPFISNDELWLTYHFIIVPSIMFHWLTNNNICCLTQLESMITGKTDTNETFLGKFINPVYAVQNKFIWTATAVLWLITVFRLQHQYQFGLLKNIFGVH